jgi:hypothetical protein
MVKVFAVWERISPDAGEHLVGLLCSDETSVPILGLNAHLDDVACYSADEFMSYVLRLLPGVREINIRPIE